MCPHHLLLQPLCSFRLVWTGSQLSSSACVLPQTSVHTSAFYLGPLFISDRESSRVSAPLNQSDQSASRSVLRTPDGLWTRRRVIPKKFDHRQRLCLKVFTPQETYRTNSICTDARHRLWERDGAEAAIGQSESPRFGLYVNMMTLM